MKKSKKYVKQEKQKTVMISARIPKSQFDLLKSENINISALIQESIANFLFNGE